MIKRSKIILVIFAALDLICWYFVFAGKTGTKSKIYFFSVGQGDSELVFFGGGKTMLIDGGPDGLVLEKLKNNLNNKKYLDLILISHSHEDHFRGILGVLKNYSVGMVFVNKSILQNEEIIKSLQEKQIPFMVLEADDKICSGGDCFKSFGKKDYFSSDENEKSLVVNFKSGKLTAFFSGDIGIKTEKVLVEKYGNELSSAILKVPHHGSSIASSDIFLKFISPVVSIIELGKNNKYNFPASSTIKRLDNSKTKTFLVSEEGDLKVEVLNDKISIEAAK